MAQEVGQHHFDCSKLEGVQLEDQGGSGTAGSHWEERLMVVNLISLLKIFYQLQRMKLRLFLVFSYLILYSPILVMCQGVP